MISLTYACGCQENGPEGVRPYLCRLHGKPVTKAIAQAGKTAELRFEVPAGQPLSPLDLEASGA